MFTDRIKLKLVAGSGGNGAVAWRREKYLPKGGPMGGNGGRGASIVLVVDEQVPSLDRYRRNRFIKADDGRGGGPNKQQGANGKLLEIRVPRGTLVKDCETGEVIRDLTEPGEKWEICRGGNGGRGNAAFATPTNRAPNKATPGGYGQECEVELELKLIADVGLVGFPNAGKSTLITKLARVRVKVAPYPFTTLVPNLGYIEFDDYSRILIADIPGIIRGASDNRGLGFEFLRHIERTKVLVFMLDSSGIDGRTPLDDFHVLREELLSYDPALLDKPYVIGLNKIDSPDSQDLVDVFHKEAECDPVRIFELSATEGDGIPQFLEAIRSLAQRDGKRFR